jgi:hypothetical protein
MAAKGKAQPSPGFIPEGIPGAGGIPQQNRVPQPPPEPVAQFTEDDMIKHGLQTASNARKNVVLNIIYTQHLQAKAPPIVTNTILEIMLDYGFVRPEDLIPPQDQQDPGQQ